MTRQVMPPPLPSAEEIEESPCAFASAYNKDRWYIYDGKSYRTFEYLNGTRGVIEDDIPKWQYIPNIVSENLFHAGHDIRRGHG